LVVVLLASVVTARDALAHQCVYRAQSAERLELSHRHGPVHHSKNSTVANNCILDFGTRAVT